MLETEGWRGGGEVPRVGVLMAGSLTVPYITFPHTHCRYTLQAPPPVHASISSNTHTLVSCEIFPPQVSGH